MGKRRPPATALVSWKNIATATGYIVYWGTTSRVYAFSHNAGNNLKYRVTNLLHGKTYYFAAKSYNAKGVKSNWSNEVSRKTAA